MNDSALEEKLQSQALSLKEHASLIVVTDEASYLRAGRFAKDIKDHKNRIIEYFRDTKKTAELLHKKIVKQETDALQPLKDADKIIRTAISAYLTEQERIRKEAQEKAEREAAEAARKEQERLLQRASNAETKGDTEKAEALLEKAENVYVRPVVVPSVVQKTTKLDTGSITQKKEIEVTITDPVSFIRAITERKAPATCVEFRLSVIKTWVKSMGIKNGEIPGLLIKEISGVSIR